MGETAQAVGAPIDVTPARAGLPRISIDRLREHTLVLDLALVGASRSSSG